MPSSASAALPLILLDPLDHLENLRQALQRQIFALERHQHRIGRGQRVGHQHAERRRAIDQHKFHRRLARAIIFQHPAQARQPVLVRRELNFATGQIKLRRDDMQAFDRSRLDLLRQRTRRRCRRSERREGSAPPSPSCPRRCSRWPADRDRSATPRARPPPDTRRDSPRWWFCPLHLSGWRSAIIFMS